MPAPHLEEEAGAGRRPGRGRWKMLLLLLVCASPVIASYFTYFVVRPGSRTNYSELIQPQRPMPAGLVLRALDGHEVPLASLADQWLIVSVGGGACDEVCESNLLVQRNVRESLGREKGRIDMVWLVTDDAPIRASLLDAMGAGPTPVSGGMHVLRATPQQVASWLVPAEGALPSDHLYLVDPRGHWMMRVPPKPEPAKLKRDLTRLLGAYSAWDEPGRTPTP